MEDQNDIIAVTTFADALVRNATVDPDREFIVMPEGRRTCSSMLERGLEVARSLLGLGVEMRDRVGILMPNCLDFVELFFGASLVGAVPVPINARFKARELGHVVRHARLKLVCTTAGVVEHTDFAALLAEALPGLDSADPSAPLDLPDAPDLSAVVLFGGTSPGGFIAEDDFDSIGSKHTDDEVHTLRHRIAVRHDALIFYTSGTTAMPKGCPLSHEAAVRTGIQTARRARWQRDERLWVPLPMFHTGFTQPLTAMMHVGGTIVTQGHFDAAEALDLIDRERVTAMFPAFPLITQSLLTHPSYSAETFRAVRTCFNVAPPEMLRSMQAKMPHTVQISGFGMTEFGGSIAMNDPSDPLDSRISNQGMPFEGVEIEIRDEENQPVSLNQRGEIVVRSPTLFSGYLNAPDDNTIEADGWFHTGDLGMLDFKGRLSYLGRLKDMLKVGGENVAAIEIESHIASHPSVINVAVVGVADAKYLEVPAAFVELRPGSDTTAEDVIAHCTGAMASFKVPRHVRFIAEWPMSATKVQKFRLREMFEAGEI